MVAMLRANGLSPTGNSLLGVPASPLGLRIVSAERAGQVVRLEAAKCIIGSAPGCTLRLRGAGLQPVHCVILRGPSGAVVKRWSADTRYNGGAFIEAPLRAGDRLGIGPVEFEVVEVPSQVSQAPDREIEVPAYVAPSIEAHAERFAALHCEKTRLLQELEAARNSLAQFQSQWRELTAALAAEQAARRAAFDDSTAHLAQLQRQLADQEALLLSERAQWEQRLREMSAAAQAQQQHTQAATADLEHQLAQTQGEVQRWRHEAQNLSRRISELQQAADAAQVAHQASLAALAAPNGENSAALAQLRCDYQAATNALAALKAQLETLTCQSNLAIAERDQLASDLANQQAQWAGAAAQRQEQAQRIEQHQGELASREANLAQRLAEIEQREEQINRYIDELAAQQSDLECRRAALEREPLNRETAPWAEPAPAREPSPAASEPLVPASPANSSEEQTEVTSGVSDILARFAHASESPAAATSEENAVAHFATSANEAPASASSPAPATHAQTHATTEEDSIEAYMARLLNRVRGAAEPAPAESTSPTNAPASASEAALRESSDEESAAILERSQFVPRVAPVERSDTLAAMRALANHSARSAIETHTKIQWGRAVLEKSIVAGSSLACGVAVLSSPTVHKSILDYGGAVVALGIGVAWTVKALMVVQQGLKAQRQAAGGRVNLGETAATSPATEPALPTPAALAAEEALPPHESA